MERSKLKLFVATVGFIAMGIAVQASDSPYTGNVNFFYGDKFMSSADWAPVENQ